MFVNHETNLAKALASWSADMPEWVRLLASVCDRSSQNAVAKRLGKSSGYVSRLINCSYAGSYAEAENLVLSIFGGAEVLCPVWGQAIPLASCMRNRRRKGPPINHDQRRWARACPGCPNNTDAPAFDPAASEEA